MSSAHVPYVIEVLQELPGFDQADLDTLEVIAERFELTKRTSGWICHEGETGDAVYILAEGEAEVIKESSGGRKYVVATLTPGVLFGHVSMITGKARTASVRNNGPITLLTLPGVALRELLRHGEWSLTSPLRRAMIIALSRQLNAATTTAMKLALDAGITETSEYEELTAEEFMTGEQHLPEDAESRIERALAQP